MCTSMQISMAKSQNFRIILTDSLRSRVREVGPTVHVSTWMSYGETRHPHGIILLDLLKNAQQLNYDKCSMIYSSDRLSK
jgi:hypothetical protein